MALVIGSGLALWALPWLAWPLWTAPVGAREFRKPPVFRYVRGVQGLDRSTWSPVLIPLPTPDGFSKKAAVKEAPRKSLGSVLKPRVSEPVFLELAPPVVPWGGNCEMSPIERQAFDPDPSSVPVFGERPLAGKTGIQIQVPEALRARYYEVSVPGDDSLAEGVWPSFSASAYVELDRRGRVQHVLLDQPTGIATVDAALVRSLRAGRGQPGIGSVAGRVKVYYWKRDGVE